MRQAQLSNVPGVTMSATTLRYQLLLCYTYEAAGVILAMLGCCSVRFLGLLECVCVRDK